MYTDEYEDYMTSEFNRLNPGLADLEKAERRSRDAAEFDSESAAKQLTDDERCPVCLMPRGLSDPEDTRLCSEHYSDWLWRRAEEQRGLRITEMNGMFWVDYTDNLKRPSYRCTPEEAERVHKQIEGQYEILVNNRWTPEREYEDLQRRAEDGEPEAIVARLERDGGEPALVAYLRRHMVAAMLKGFMLNREHIARLIVEYNAPDQCTTPFWYRHPYTYKDRDTGEIKLIPF